MDYAIKFKGHGVFTPEGKQDIPSEVVDKTNRKKEQAEIAWLKTGPDKVVLYVHHYPDRPSPFGGIGQWVLNTWLGTEIDPSLAVGPRRQVGFGFHTYRRAVTARIFGVLYHGWYMESSGEYCRLKRAKRQ